MRATSFSAARRVRRVTSAISASVMASGSHCPSSRLRCRCGTAVPGSAGLPGQIPILPLSGYTAASGLCFVESMSTRIGSSVSLRTWCAPSGPSRKHTTSPGSSRARPPDRGGSDGRRSRGATPRCRTRSGTGRFARRARELVHARTELLGADPLADRCASPPRTRAGRGSGRGRRRRRCTLTTSKGRHRTPAAASVSASPPASPCRPLRLEHPARIDLGDGVLHLAHAGSEPLRRPAAGPSPRRGARGRPRGSRSPRS